MIKRKMYNIFFQSWDLVHLTQNYLKILLQFLKESKFYIRNIFIDL